MAITLEQVARLAGVSLSTASRVINEHPNVRPEVRERVWQVIHEYGYQPDLAARSLALKRSDDAVIAPDTHSAGGQAAN